MIRRPDLQDAIESGHQTPVCDATDEGWLCTLIQGHVGREHAAGVGSHGYAHIWPTGEREPLQVICPNCQARAGDPCTSPTSTGRRTIKRVHVAREEAARG